MKLNLIALCSAVIINGINGNSILPEKNSCLGRSLFGKTTSDYLDTTLTLRGGEVLESKTWGEVETIIMRASNEGKLVVIDFSATWCGPCKMIAPLYEELSEDFSNAIFLKVDVDENHETAAKYGVKAMPTFLFIKRGEVVDAIQGANPALLKNMLEEHA